MPTQKDRLAYKFIDLERRRAAGEFTYATLYPAAGQEGVSAERINWNVAASDMSEIERVLAGDEPLTDKVIETDESNIDQINDAVRRMKQGDVSKYNHLPQFLREYYGRIALT